MQRIIFLSGAVLGGLSVILGAFGAHALRSKLSPEQLQVFQTGVTYQFYHAFALLITGLMMYRIQSPLMNYAGTAFIAGTLFFSGSLYLLSTTSITGLESIKPMIGPVTPLGGLFLIFGWIMLIVVFIKTEL
jgi:uncharacterized membrane protein YgdD (TMEM256/DUF423 family)